MKENKFNIKFFMGISAVFVVAMYFLSASTSPFMPDYYGMDSSLFRMIARGMLRGKTLYVDLFDHKGPILFFIEVLGELLGKYGIWAIQCVFGIVSLFFSYKILLLLRKNDKSIIPSLLIMASGILYFLFTDDRGNYSEELSLPFICVCLYLFIKYSLNEKSQSKHPPVYAFVYGICFAFIALMRLNNAVTVCAGIFAILVHLILKKEWKNICLNLLMGILGILVVFVPVCFYFYFKDALYEMLYATFIYNFLYVGNSGHLLILLRFKLYMAAYSPILVSSLLIIRRFKKRSEKSDFTEKMILTVFIANSVCLLLINAWAHYFIILAPVYVLVLGRYFETDVKFKDKLSFEKVPTYFAYICLAGLICVNISTLITYFGDRFVTHSSENEYRMISDSLSRIPEDEKNSVIGYEVPEWYYLEGDIVPCYKYYAHQEWWSINNPDICNDFMEWAEEKKPKWIFIAHGEDDKRIIGIINRYYEKQFEDELVCFYRLKDIYDENEKN